jgi:hypothetical protein
VDNYYEEGLLFNPIAATKRRQQVQRFIAKRYCCTVPKKTRLHHKISKLLKAFDNKSIPLIKLLSISWVSIKTSKPKGNHLNTCPLVWYPGSLPSLGSGKSFQPLKQNYENWLKRIEGFKQWADTAIANFDGIAIGMVLPKTLVVKWLNTNCNRYAQKYEPVRNMPASFSEKEKLSFDWPIKIQSTVKSFLLTENWLII